MNKTNKIQKEWIEQSARTFIEGLPDLIFSEGVKRKMWTCATPFHIYVIHKESDGKYTLKLPFGMIWEYDSLAEAMRGANKHWKDNLLQSMCL